MDLIPSCDPSQDHFRPSTTGSFAASGDGTLSLLRTTGRFWRILGFVARQATKVLDKLFPRNIVFISRKPKIPRLSGVRETSCTSVSEVSGEANLVEGDL